MDDLLSFSFFVDEIIWNYKAEMGESTSNVRSVATLKKKKKTKSNNTERFAMFKLLGAKNRVISGFASVVAALQVVQLALGLDVEVKEDETVTRQALTDLQRFIICILLVGGEIRVKEIALSHDRFRQFVAVFEPKYKQNCTTFSKHPMYKYVIELPQQERKRLYDLAHLIFVN